MKLKEKRRGGETGVRCKASCVGEEAERQGGGKGTQTAMRRCPVSQVPFWMAVEHDQHSQYLRARYRLTRPGWKQLGSLESGVWSLGCGPWFLGCGLWYRDAGPGIGTNAERARWREGDGSHGRASERASRRRRDGHSAVCDKVIWYSAWQHPRAAPTPAAPVGVTAVHGRGTSVLLLAMTTDLPGFGQALAARVPDGYSTVRACVPRHSMAYYAIACSHWASGQVGTAHPDC